jgi:hypothetical protein
VALPRRDDDADGSKTDEVVGEEERVEETEVDVGQEEALHSKRKKAKVMYSVTYAVTFAPFTTSFCTESSKNRNQAATMLELIPNMPRTNARHQNTFSFARSFVVKGVTRKYDPM